MVMGPVFRITNSDYSFLYLPAIAYGYLLYETEPHSIDFLIATVPSEMFFQSAVLICVVGALIYHQIFRLIFGNEGPSVNPKKSIVVLKHMLTFISRCDIRDADNNSQDVIQTIINRVKLRHIVPIVGFGIPVAAMFLLTYASVVFLYDVVVTGQPDSFFGSVLLIALIISLLQPRVWAYLPSYIPQDSAENIWTPEYRRGVEAAEASQDSVQRTINEEWQ